MSHRSIIIYFFFTRHFIPSANFLCFNSLIFASFLPNPIRLFTLRDEPISFSSPAAHRNNSFRHCSRQKVPRQKAAIVNSKPLSVLPKIDLVFWATSARSTGTCCPALVLWMPTWWAVDAHATGMVGSTSGHRGHIFCSLCKRLRVYTIVDFSFIRTFAPSF